ncbi:hypothetical protein ABPG74_019445 [Tetrahymena malaccensis]
MQTQTASKDKSKPVTIFARDIIRCDLKEYEYRYFKDIIESQITENMIAEKRVKVIKKVFEDFTNDEIKQEYIIVVATDVSYYLQQFIKQFLYVQNIQFVYSAAILDYIINRQKLSGLLMLLLGDVCIFIYKPKHLEVPKALKLEHIEPEPFKDKLDLMLSKIKIVNQKGFETDQGKDAVSRIVEYIALYYLKHQKEYGMKGSKFEEDFHQKVKNHLAVYSTTSYYHCFMGRKLDILLSQDEKYSQYLEVEMNFTGIIPNINSTYKFVIFNKRGTEPTVFDLAKFKLREIFGFFAMLMIFVSLIVCRDFDPNTESVGNHAIRDAICPHKQELMGVSLTIFLSVVLQKMFNKYKERRQRKIELQKRLKLEKAE